MSAFTRTWLSLWLILSCLGLTATDKLILASTTSTLDSGLFDVLIPPFEKAHDCRVKIIAVGTGQAMRLGRDGNADVLLVHDRASEEAFVAEGFGLERLPVMHNDFLLAGPRNDPAGIADGSLSLAQAMKRIMSAGHPFVSRGDDSGTHKMELRLWAQAEVKPKGPGYLESGSGMEVSLRIANEKRAYCLVDRATWLAHVGEMDVLAELLSGREELFNPYAVIVVSPQRFPWVKHQLAQKFADFLRGPEGQQIIRDYGKEQYGAALFFPDVIK